MVKSLKLWTYAARPKTLFIGIAPIMIGTAMAFYAHSFHLPTFLWTLLGALMIQIGTNYSNDYFDFLTGADTSNRKGSKKVLQEGLVTPAAMKIAFISCFAIAALCSCVLAQRGGLTLLIVGALCITFSILYTAPPFPLAYVGLGDAFVLLFYGPVATLMCYYLQTFHLSYEVLVASFAPRALGVAVLNLNNLRDHDEDKAVHKNTLVVRFGILFGKLHYLMALLLSFVIPPLLIIYTQGHFFSLMASFSLLATLPAIKITFTYNYPSELNYAFAQTARVIPLYTCLFSIGWLI